MDHDSPHPIPLRILGTGEYIPSRRVDSNEFDRRWSKPDGWTRRHVGIDYRHFAGADEPASMMAAQAAQDALRRADLRADQVDAVISVSGVMEQAIPCTAALVQRRLGLSGSRIPAFDVNATCLGFLVALDLVASAIATHRFRRVLLVAGEVASAGLDWDDTDTAALFGDGAAAVVVEAAGKGDASCLLATHMETHSEGTEFCQVRAGGTRVRLSDGAGQFSAASRFEMSGRATYRLAAQKLPGFMRALFDRANVAAGDLKRLVPHQASVKALDHLQRALRLPQDSLVRILETHGNQMAASIPLALHHAIEHGELRRGDLFAMVGSGAGLSFAGAVLRY
ncbi:MULTISPECIES: beta-ketoacyl-ACP synthase 3 [Stenotrophomonas]|uniref:beta-ketoacyl-ACP synthase 3 n=1 Tax=Stenotrophomonas TaxID=40323 RepID=UPI001CF437F0|nr:MULTISPECIES: beta-ketoacyl-ACP synthase 3 [Stenotrophomonas]MCA7024133.1 beta-ketoacyl-ACP synthase 3 [Stenotrophomonas acidaminiphila]MCE4074884.1 beta-ketoacyl-ACP synthase 3 [Stenotrophomonas acidaminiphila]